MADVKNSSIWNLAPVIVGAVAIAAAGAWTVFRTGPDEEPERAPKSVEAKASKSDGLPPMRALPPPGTDLLPPLQMPPEIPKSEQAAAPAGQAEPAKSVPTPPAKVAGAPPALPAPPAQKAQPVVPATPAPAPAPKRVEKAVSEPSVLATGNYVGNIRGGEAAGLTLVISSAEGGAVRGTAHLAGAGACDDAYPMQGSVRGSSLELRATKMGGRANDCPLTLTLTIEGDRMSGSSGSGGSVQLRKR